MAQKTNVDFGEVEKVLKELEKELKQCKGVQVGWLESEMALDHDRNPTQTKQGEVVLKLNFGSPEERKDASDRAAMNAAMIKRALDEARKKLEAEGLASADDIRAGILKMLGV